MPVRVWPRGLLGVGVVAARCVDRVRELASSLFLLGFRFDQLPLAVCEFNEDVHLVPVLFYPEGEDPGEGESRDGNTAPDVRAVLEVGYRAGDVVVLHQPFRESAT